jgi:hypothetical protein
MSCEPLHINKTTNRNKIFSKKKQRLHHQQYRHPQQPLKAANQMS